MANLLNIMQDAATWHKHCVPKRENTFTANTQYAFLKKTQLVTPPTPAQVNHSVIHEEHGCPMHKERKTQCTHQYLQSTLQQTFSITAGKPTIAHLNRQILRERPHDRIMLRRLLSRQLVRHLLQMHTEAPCLRHDRGLL
jgi:hypothetical protein